MRLLKGGRKMLESIMLFVLGFTCVTSVYEISKSGKSSKSEKTKRAAGKLVDRK